MISGRGLKEETMNRTLRLRIVACAGICAILLLGRPTAAHADEGGVSFWLPGNFGSLAAVPGAPGWSWATVVIHTEVNSGAGAQFPRGGRLDLGINGVSTPVIFGPSYTIVVPELNNAVIAFGLFGVGGRIDANVAASLTGPLGNTINLSKTQGLTSFGDVIPQVTVKWNQGVNNFMIYGTGDVPIGDYDPNRIANLGIGHGAIDFGAGYTYFNPHTGIEFSGTAGLTYNFKNPDTQYQNGIDFHFDWGASYFLNQAIHLGLVGYYFQQITDDFGAPPAHNGFRGRVSGIGPQVGILFPVANMQGYLNVKGYKEFAAENRPEGWNGWITFSIAEAPPTPEAKPIVRKY
jgi:hypothetical protein